MPVTVTSSTTTTGAKIGFASSSAENKALSDALLAWTESQPGFISQSFEATGAPGPAAEKVHTYTVVWETVEDYANWITARNERPEYLARKAYNEANGIVFTVTESMS